MSAVPAPPVPGRRPTRLTGGLRGARWTVLAVAVSMLGDLVWLLRDDSDPSYDQSGYLRVAWTYVLTARHQGLGALPHELMTLDPSRGPLYPLILSPFMAAFGPDTDAAVVLGLIALACLLVTVGDVAARLAGPRARLPAVLLSATMPIIYGLSREVLVDLLLCSLSAASVWAALRCGGLSRLRWSAALGVLVGLTTLTKVTAPAFVVVPCALALFVRSNEHRATTLGRRVLGGALVVAATAASTLWWYVPHLAATRDYIRATTTGSLAAGAGPAHPFALSSLVRFVLGAVNQHTGWPVVLLGVAVAAAVVVRGVRHGVRWPRPGSSVRAALLLGWLVVPVLVVGLGPNQDVRLVAPALLALPIGVAALLTKLETRVSMTGSAVAVAGLGLLAHTVPLGATALRLQVPTHFGVAALTESADTQGYARVPGPPRAPALIAWAEQQTAAHGLQRPAVVGLLEQHPEINLNTLGWYELVEPHGDAPTFVYVPAAASSAALTPALASLDAVVVITDASTDGRLAAVNGQLAGGLVTARQLSSFSADVEQIPVDPQGIAVLRWRSTSATP